MNMIFHSCVVMAIIGTYTQLFDYWIIIAKLKYLIELLTCIIFIVKKHIVIAYRIMVHLEVRPFRSDSPGLSEDGSVFGCVGVMMVCYLFTLDAVSFYRKKPPMTYQCLHIFVS